MNANDVMTAQVQSCSRQDSLEQVARQMWEHDCGAIPVVDEQQHPVGIITDRDIAMASMLNHRPQWEMTAGELTANQTLHTCTQDDPVQVSLALMEKYGIRRIPVTDAEGQLAGIISMGDAVAFTSNGTARGNSQQLTPNQTLTMLKSISAHHAASTEAADMQQ